MDELDILIERDRGAARRISINNKNNDKWWIAKTFIFWPTSAGPSKKIGIKEVIRKELKKKERVNE